MRCRALLTMLPLLLLSSCSADDPVTPEASPPLRVSLEESVGTAGSTVGVEGLDPAETDLDAITVEVDGQPAFLVSNPAGDVRMVIPPALDPETFQIVPSAEPMDIVFRSKDGTVLLELPAALTVEAPAPAPGTCQRLVDALDRSLTAMGTVLASLPAEVGLEQQALVSLEPVLRSLLDAESPVSIPSQLAALDEDQLATLDALWNASGYPDDMEELAAVSEAVATRIAKRKSAAIELDDSDLAVLMQFTVYAKRYGEWYVHGIAESISFGNTATGFLGILIQGAPLVGQVFGAVNFVVSLFDFIINEHLIALMPTRVDQIDLTMEETRVVAGGTTQSTKIIRVSNDPPGVTLNDFIAQLLNAIGILAPTDYPPVQDALLQLSSFIVEQINNALSSYAEAHPDILVPAEIYQVPEIEWTAVLDNTDLFLVQTFSTDFVEPESELGEWRALNTQGDATVWIRPSSAPEAIAIDLGIIEYNAGAFGEDLTKSNDLVVEVRTPLAMELDFAPTFAPDGINALGVQLEYLDMQGNTIPAAGVTVSLQVDGGSADTPSGTSDADGQFVALVQPDSGSDLLTVTVTASDSFGEEATGEVQSTLAGNALVTLSGGRVQMSAGYLVGAGDYGPGYAPELRTDDQRIDEQLQIEGLNQVLQFSESLTHAGTGMSAQATASSSLQLEFETDLQGSIIAIRGSLDMSASASHSGDTQYTEGSGNAYARVTMAFEVHDSAVPFTLTSTFNGTPAIVDLVDEFYHHRSDGPIPASFDASGVLEPGSYDIWFYDLGIYALSNAATQEPSASGGWSFELRLN